MPQGDVQKGAWIGNRKAGQVVVAALHAPQGVLRQDQNAGPALTGGADDLAGPTPRARR